jgi:hypothetical protein
MCILFIPVLLFFFAIVLLISICQF